MKRYIKSAVADPNQEDFISRLAISNSPRYDSVTRQSVSDTLRADKDRDLQNRFDLAYDPDTTPEVLDRLAALYSHDTDLDNYVSSLIAENPNTSTDTLSRLADRKSIGVKLLVAENRNATSEILQKIARSRVKNTRFWRRLYKILKDHPNADPSLRAKAEAEL